MDRYSALFFILFLVSPTAYSDEYYIEDISSTPVDIQAGSAIRKYAVNDKFWLDRCDFSWEQISLGDSTENTFMIVTTEKACGWGAAAGPVWLLRYVDNDYSVLLSSSGYTIETTAHISNGLPDIRISSDTAGWSSDARWSFNGTKYIKTEDNSTVKH